MPIDKRVSSAAQALADVKDGATVLISGFGGAGFPNVLIHALRELGAKDLTLVVNSATHRFSLTHELLEIGHWQGLVSGDFRNGQQALFAIRPSQLGHRSEPVVNARRDFHGFLSVILGRLYQLPEQIPTDLLGIMACCTVCCQRRQSHARGLFPP